LVHVVKYLAERILGEDHRRPASWSTLPELSGCYLLTGITLLRSQESTRGKTDIHMWSTSHSLSDMRNFRPPTQYMPVNPRPSEWTTEPRPITGVLAYT